MKGKNESWKTLFLVGLLVLASIFVFHPIPMSAAASTLTIRPNGAGTFSEWIPVGDSPNYQCVDEETRDDDATYVGTAVAKKSDCYHLQDHTTETGNISNVRVVVWAYDVGGPENIQLMVVFGGPQKYLGAIQVLTGSYAQYTEDWAQNPETRVDWTWSDIDALEAGIYSLSAGQWAGDIHVTQLFVEVTYAGITPPDVAIVSVTPFPTRVNPSQMVNITVIAENQGGSTETFNVTAYYDTTAIETQTVTSLPAGDNRTLTFIWDTTGVAESNYTIKAIADVVPGEVDIADNTYVDGTVTITRPTVSIYPPSIIGPPPNIAETFDINVTISDVADLYSWQVGMTFNPDVLEAVSFTEGPFLKQGGTTIFINGTINNTAGTITYYACSLAGNILGVSGNGTLGTITFRVKGSGNSTLHLVDVILLDSESTETSRNLVDGFVSVQLVGDVNDDGIVDIFDIGEVSAHWYPGPPEGPLGYDSQFDLNDDGNIDISDIEIVSAQWGETA